MFPKSFISVAAVAAVTGLAATSALAQITIPTVTVGNAGNAADRLTGLGSVAYTYNIGTTEVTNAQYVAFLNAKAASDPYGLYNPRMVEFAGITRSGSAGSYTYSIISGRESNPVSDVSFWDAARFVNWLQNGQGNGDTETGAYTLGGVENPANNSVSRNAGWQWALPNQDEWYKAAFYQPASQGGDIDNYWLYTTQSNSEPTTAQANFARSVNDTMPVGSYAANSYGAFDMGGNVIEWTESTLGESSRWNWGGSYVSPAFNLSANNRVAQQSAGWNGVLGFRVVAIPAPSAAVLLAIGGIVTARRRR
jgi:sulfatase modifying factor 1